VHTPVRKQAATAPWGGGRGLLRTTAAGATLLIGYAGLESWGMMDIRPKEKFR
jgi:hypothetical protein